MTKANRVPTTCKECGTHVDSAQALKFHKQRPWHKIAREARKLRKQGVSYSDIAFHFKGAVTSQLVWLNLKREGL
jgi:hypothetical protein